MGGPKKRPLTYTRLQVTGTGEVQDMSIQKRSLSNYLLECLDDGAETCTMTLRGPTGWGPPSGSSGRFDFTKKGGAVAMENAIRTEWQAQKDASPDIMAIRLFCHRVEENNGRSKQITCGNQGGWSQKAEDFDGVIERIEKSQKESAEDLVDILKNPGVSEEKKTILTELYFAKHKATLHPDAKSHAIAVRTIEAVSSVNEKQQKRIESLEGRLDGLYTATINNERDRVLRLESENARLQAKVMELEGKGTVAATIDAIGRATHGNPVLQSVISGVVEGTGEVTTGDISKIAKGFSGGFKDSMKMMLSPVDGDKKESSIESDMEKLFEKGKKK